MDATYWFEKGLLHKQIDQWGAAYSCFERTTELDATHWQAWLLLSLIAAYMDEAETCRRALFNAEVYGRPASENNFIHYLSTDELKLLTYFLEARSKDTQQFLTAVSLALVYFYAQKFNQALSLLTPFVSDKSEQAAWAHYFSSRIYLEQGNFKAAIGNLEFLSDNFLDYNPRVNFILAKAQVQDGCQSFASFLEWEAKNEGSTGFYPSYNDLFGSAKWRIESAIENGHIQAEYYAVLGQAHRAVGGRGSGFEEYHEAVKLDPENKEYIEARAICAWSAPDEIDSSEPATVIAYAAVADIQPNNLHHILDAAIAFYHVESYASALLLFDQAAQLMPGPNEPAWYVSHVANSRANHAELRDECLNKLPHSLNNELIRSLAKTEREAWNRLALLVRYKS